MKQLWDNRITELNLGVGAVTWQGKSNRKLWSELAPSKTLNTVLVSVRIRVTHFWGRARGSCGAAHGDGAGGIQAGWAACSAIT